jgi:hypothetical protein
MGGAHRGEQIEGSDDSGAYGGILCASCGCSVCAVEAELGDTLRTRRAHLPAVLSTRYPLLPP